MSPSEGSRTDTVVALGRRPLNWVIAMVLLLLLGGLGVWMLPKKQAGGTDKLPPPPPPSTVAPPPTSPPPTTEPAPATTAGSKPAVETTPTAGHDRGDSKHKGKKHKKSSDGAKEGDDAAGESGGKKPRAAKSGDTPWDPDSRSGAM